MTEHFDVAIVGAGISGIGIAYYLKQRCPDKSFVVLEGLERFGGTWTTHRYPGIRSDSDLNTYGYSFKPWVGSFTATAAEILNYLGEVINENGLASHIRYQHHLESVKWYSKEHSWTIEGVRQDTGEAIRLTCNFLSMCQGYYRHAQGYTPQWEGMDDFAGEIVHPQTWPQDLDYEDKEVLVIGSGSTMSTLVPAIAYDAKHVTVLQRSPTFFFPIGDEDNLAEQLRALDIDESWIHEIVRRKRIYNGQLFARRAAAEPEVVREELIAAVRQQLPEGYDVETHFMPQYRPWQQRIARVPNGDFFTSIRDGRTTMVTDEIERFTEQGVLVKSGRELPADIAVTATGFDLCVFGDIAFTVDDRPLDIRRNHYLSRYDVHRRAQYGLGLRLFPRQLDAASRSGRRFYLPALAAYGSAGLQIGRAHTAARPTGDAAVSAGGPRGFQPQLHPARPTSAA